MKQISDARRIELKERKLEKEALIQLYREIWDEREDEEGYCYCFETNTPMHGSQYRGNPFCYDHVLDKRKTAYPQYKFTKENIIIVLPYIHRLKTNNIRHTPKIQTYRDYLLSLHYENKLEENVRDFKDRLLE